MAKFQCECGTILSSVGSPNSIEHYILNDYQMDALDLEDTCDKILDIAISVWKCNSCKRLNFFDEINRLTQVYVLEKENTYEEG